MQSAQLESTIDSHSKQMANAVTEAARNAHSEEDIRVACSYEINRFIESKGLTLHRGAHEYRAGKGSIDSKYGYVFIEYKNPKGVASRLSKRSDSHGVKAVVSQIESRFEALSAEEDIQKERLLGIGIDGRYILYARYHGNTFVVDNPEPITPMTLERSLRAIVSLGAHGFSFTPQALSNAFGSESDCARKSVQALYKTVTNLPSGKANTLFRQWEVLFGEVCGYNLQDSNPKIAKLAQAYGTDASNQVALLLEICPKVVFKIG